MLYPIPTSKLPKITKQDLANPVLDSTDRISWYKIAVDKCYIQFLHQSYHLNKLIFCTSGFCTKRLHTFICISIFEQLFHFIAILSTNGIYNWSMAPLIMYNYSSTCLHHQMLGPVLSSLTHILLNILMTKNEFYVHVKTYVLSIHMNNIRGTGPTVWTCN